MTEPLVQAQPAQSARPEEILAQAFSRLPERDAQVLQAFYEGRGATEQQQSFDRLKQSTGFRSANEDTLLAILKALAEQERSQGSAGLHFLLNEAGFAKLTAEQQVMAITLASRHCKRAGLAEGLGMLLRRSDERGQPLLLSRDSKGNTLLDNLCTFSHAKPHEAVAAAGIDADSCIVDLAREIAYPERYVDQGNRGACAAASIQDVLCREQPAEYLRLFTELFSNARASALGGELALAQDALHAKKDRTLNSPDLRSHPERLFQSSLLAAVASIGEYSYDSDSARLQVPKGLQGAARRVMLPRGFELPFGGGMNAGELHTAMKLLFGERAYSRVSGGGKDIHAQLRQSERPSVVTLAWDGGLHALVYTATADGYVYLKDPNGATPAAEGSPVPRDPSSAHRANTRMKVDVFERALRGAEVPVARQSRRQDSPSLATSIQPLVDAVTLPAPLAVRRGQQLTRSALREAEHVNNQFGGLLMPALPLAREGASRLHTLFGK